MTLTPEEWKELDRLERFVNNIENVDDPTYAARRAEYRNLLLDYDRSLIDAARSQCRCGDGLIQDGWYNDTCPDCDGTGWAQ